MYLCDYRLLEEWAYYNSSNEMHRISLNNLPVTYKKHGKQLVNKMKPKPPKFIKKMTSFLSSIFNFKDEEAHNKVQIVKEEPTEQIKNFLREYVEELSDDVEPILAKLADLQLETIEEILTDHEKLKMFIQ